MSVVDIVPVSLVLLHSQLFNPSQYVGFIPVLDDKDEEDDGKSSTFSSFFTFFASVFSFKSTSIFSSSFTSAFIP